MCRLLFRRYVLRRTNKQTLITIRLLRCHNGGTVDKKTSTVNKTVIDRRLHPRCCQLLGSYCKRPKSSPVRPLACNWYYCAQFVAKPKAACALRFSWAATSSNRGLSANMTSSVKPEVHNVSLRGYANI